MQVAAIVRWLSSFYFKYPLNFIFTSAVPIAVMAYRMYHAAHSVNYEGLIFQGGYLYSVGFIVFGFFFNFVNNRENGYLRQLFFFTGNIPVILRGWFATQTTLFFLNFLAYCAVVSVLAKHFDIALLLKYALCSWVYVIVLGQLLLLIATRLKIRQQTAVLIPSLLYMFFLIMPYILGNQWWAKLINPMKWMVYLLTHWSTPGLWIGTFIILGLFVGVFKTIKPPGLIPSTRGGE